jgi:hypothetical protein
MTWSYTSPVLGMPYLLPSQAQKHVTVNEALRALDALVQLVAISRTIATPPPTPAEGDRYIVAAAASGVWSARDGEIAAFMDGGWRFHAPKEGFAAWIADEEAWAVFDGADWQFAITGAPLFGVNATADATNRLAISSAASLLTHEGDDHQLKINKAATGDTAALLFQTGLSGRAEIGLLGDDDLSFKVFGSDSVWRAAITVDRDTGEVALPNTSPSAGLRLVAIARDVKTSGADGGTFTSGARRTRALNSLETITPGLVSLSSNALTIAAGSYFFRWSCPGYKAGSHRSFLRDTTHSIDLGLGGTAFASASDPAQSNSAGLVSATLASSTIVQLEHRSTLTQARVLS